MKPALVVWEDAGDIDDSPWAEHDESFVYEPILITEVGYILYDGEEGIILTHAHYEETVGRRSQIPRGMIRSIKYLEV